MVNIHYKLLESFLCGLSPFQRVIADPWEASLADSVGVETKETHYHEDLLGDGVPDEHIHSTGDTDMIGADPPIPPQTDSSLHDLSALGDGSSFLLSNGVNVPYHQKSSETANPSHSLFPDTPDTNAHSIFPLSSSMHPEGGMAEAGDTSETFAPEEGHTHAAPADPPATAFALPADSLSPVAPTAEDPMNLHHSPEPPFPTPAVSPPFRPTDNAPPPPEGGPSASSGGAPTTTQPAAGTPAQAQAPATGVTGYRRFIERIKSRPLQYIVPHIKEFVASFPANLSRHDAAARLHAFLSDAQDEIAKSAVYKELDEAEQLEMREGLEKFLMIKLHHRLWRCEAEDEGEDKFLSRHIARLSWVKPHHLECLELSEDAVTLAAGELCKMDQYKAPRDKIVCMMNACRVLYSAIRDQAESGSRNGEGPPPSADDFLPCLILLVIRANPPCLHSNCEFVGAFRHPDRLRAEDLYFFTQLASVVTFIKKINGSNELKVTQEEFDRLYGPPDTAETGGEEQGASLEKKQKEKENGRPPTPPQSSAATDGSSSLFSFSFAAGKTGAGGTEGDREKGQGDSEVADGDRELRDLKQSRSRPNSAGGDDGGTATAMGGAPPIPAGWGASSASGGSGGGGGSFLSSRFLGLFPTSLSQQSQPPQGGSGPPSEGTVGDGEKEKETILEREKKRKTEALELLASLSSLSCTFAPVLGPMDGDSARQRGWGGPAPDLRVGDVPRLLEEYRQMASLCMRFRRHLEAFQ
uniref:VPS9 domain-containing protein n=1 Tax=Chromera velia CCMP2878 TaxID=1169474 RepID=A0A0G4HUK5_9ALVE|eukprot:Cvel_8668.t1-p1 / transcript=Cvel_8668.t1 / gene=Cvel_8668 / organism=Chromera_velia_CCMP2878 / gene_product=Vacuolar protein sorting-associated protein 9A, putative / transcript_product=Vacuolar protein sorting-associated protein 9A, putative / location=Cvel_scaffold483:60841-67040(+) / protein_length=751 / sequence_SO=supercontig / SO=protein_coding / is_pseudo=false